MKTGCIKKLLITTAAVFLAGYGVHAQITPPPLSLASSPAAPSPGQQVTIQAATPTFDKDAAFFEWTVDGEPRPDFSGQGKNTITVTAGELGSVMRVSVRVVRAGGGAEVSLQIRAADLSLTWSAETIAPKWYKGKALPTSGSIVDIAAIPGFIIDGQTIKPDALIYRWTLDDQTNALVGLGKQVFRIKTSDLPQTSHQIEVVVEDPDKKIRKTGRMFVVPTTPRAVIYPFTPLGGIESRTTNQTIGQRRGLSDFAAEPFFFPVASKQNLAWVWDIGGTPAQSSASGASMITIDTTNQPQGTLPISVRVEYAKSLIPQSASKILNLFLQ